MAYLKRRSYIRPARGRYPSSKVTPRRRRYAAKKKTYRKKPRAFRKRVLNISSRKKQDNMRGATYDPLDPGGTVTAGPVSFNAVDGLQTMLWMPTGRTRETIQGGDQGTVDDTATRTASTVFYRGLRERVQIQTSGSGAWQWRRICFEFNSNALEVGIPGQTAVPQPYLFTSSGNMRGLGPGMQAGALGTAYLQHVINFVFKGRQTVDYGSLFTAKTDPSRVKIVYDKLRIIQSHNDTGIIRNYKMWFPMNKTFVYDEDEDAAEQSEAVYGAATRGNMGNYYIFDLIFPALSNTDESISFDPEATLYWHER